MENITDATDFPEDRAEGLVISSTSATHLRDTGGWATVLAVSGFLIAGLMIIGSLFVSQIFSRLGMPMVGPAGMIFGVMYFVFGVIYLLPFYFLFMFTRKIKTAITHKDNLALEDALSNLRKHYKVIGIMIIIIGGLYAFVIVSSLLVYSFS